VNFDPKLRIQGRVWKFGDSIDTDCILPFHRYPDPEELKKHTMEAARPEFARQVSTGDILVAGRNFGCGSARMGSILFEVGIVALVAESFSTLFMRNCIASGHMVFAVPGVSELVEDGSLLEIDYAGGCIRNLATAKALSLVPYPPLIEALLMQGGMLAYTKAKFEAERRL
jgi:3-isopropylmalate dehydratase small subunit